MSKFTFRIPQYAFWFNNEPGNSTLEERNELCINPHIVARSSGTYCCYICQQNSPPFFECCECKKIVCADHMCYDVWLRLVEDVSCSNYYKVCSVCVTEVNRRELERRLKIPTPYRAPAGCVQRLRGTNSFAPRPMGLGHSLSVSEPSEQSLCHTCTHCDCTCQSDSESRMSCQTQSVSECNIVPHTLIGSPGCAGRQHLILNHTINSMESDLDLAQQDQPQAEVQDLQEFQSSADSEVEPVESSGSLSQHETGGHTLSDSETQCQAIGQSEASMASSDSESEVNRSRTRSVESEIEPEILTEFQTDAQQLLDFRSATVPQAGPSPVAPDEGHGYRL